MSLQNTFEKSQAQEKVQQYELHGVKVNVTPSEKAFAEELFDSLASIPSGRKAIEDMKKYKVDFFLETSLGSAGGYFDAEENRIVMAKSLGKDFMQFAVVHEARHLLQSKTGREKAEAKNLDYASRLMINRATEADAQVQALLACKEWEAQGNDAPLKEFTSRYQPIVDRFNKTGKESDAFKGWYDDERIPAAYELSYDIKPTVKSLFVSPDKKPYVSLKPADIAKFCGADRVEGFEEFVSSEKANQVHLATKTVMEMQDANMTAKGGAHDASIEKIPVRKLKGNSAAQIYAAKNIQEAKKTLSFCRSIDPRKAVVNQAISTALDAVQKVNAAEVNGTRDEEAEKALKKAKNTIRTNPLKRSGRGSSR